MKINHISLDISDFKRLKLWTAIPFLRDQQGHYIDIKPSAFSDMIPDFSNFQPLTVLIEKELAITLDKEFIEQIFSVFINNDFALSYEYLTEAATTNLVIKEKITDIASILHNISTHLGIVIPNRNHLLKEIYNISNFAFKTKKGYYPPPFILFDSKKSFVKSVDRKSVV